LYFLEIFDASGRDFPELTTALDDELVDYLSRLEGFPALQSLGRIGGEEETQLGEALREDLWNELGSLAPQVQGRRLPEPPAWVGLEGLDDIRVGEEFGWAGLVDFLSRLQRLLAMARKPGMEIRVSG
jgi:bacterioferritin (cytochrome b1)